MPEYWPTSTTDDCISNMDILHVTAITMISVWYETLKKTYKNNVKNSAKIKKINPPNQTFEKI